MPVNPRHPFGNPRFRVLELCFVRSRFVEHGEHAGKGEHGLVFVEVGWPLLGNSSSPLLAWWFGSSLVGWTF